MTPRAAPRTIQERSAGGVAWRGDPEAAEIVLVEVGERRRWQLPKGIVDAGESPESAALRETREEAGIVAELDAPLGEVEYWYVRSERGTRVRVHKRVAFYLLRAVGGDVADHDHEVHSARWAPIAEAEGMLAFESERDMVRLAREALSRRREA